MTTYYVTTRQSFYKDYKVEASSKEEAEKIVMNEPIDHYTSDFGARAARSPSQPLFLLPDF